MPADWMASGACTSGSTAPPKGATKRAFGGFTTTGMSRWRDDRRRTSTRAPQPRGGARRGRLARPRSRAHLRRHGAPDLSVRRRRGHDVRDVTAERNGPDVCADERIPLHALAETDLSCVTRRSSQMDLRPGRLRGARGRRLEPKQARRRRARDGRRPSRPTVPPVSPSEITFAAGSTPSATAKSEPCGIANSILSVSDSWYRMTSHSRRYRRTRRAQKRSTREDHFMKIEIEYCGQ